MLISDRLAADRDGSRLQLIEFMGTSDRTFSGSLEAIAFPTERVATLHNELWLELSSSHR